MAPPAIPLLAGLATSALVEAAFTTATAFTIGGFAISSALVGQFAGGIVSFGLSSLLSPKAKSQNQANSIAGDTYPFVNQGTKTTIRNTISFAPIVYGTMTSAGTLLFEKISSSGTDNLGNTVSGLDVYLNRLICYAYHECDAFVGLSINDIPVTLDSNGWVQQAAFTKNSDTVAPKAATIFASVGDAQTATGSGNSASIKIGVAYATASALIGVGELIQVSGLSDTAYNGQFVITSISSSAAGASTQINYTTDIAISSSGISQASLKAQVNAVGWRGTTAYMYDNANHGLIGGDNVFISEASPALFNIDKTPVTGTPSVRTFTYTFTGTPTTGSISGQFQRRNGTDQALVNIQTFLGAPGQNIGANSMVNTLLPSVFTATDLGSNLCCAFVRYFDASQFTSDPVLKATIQGAKLYDPRNGTKYFSNNAAMVTMDYLTRTIGSVGNEIAISMGLDYNSAVNTSTDLDITNFANAADICDIPITLLDSSTEPQYTIDGIISCGDNPIDILSVMVPHTGGAFTYFDWVAKLFPAEYTPPTAAIDTTWLTDSIVYNETNDNQNLSNTVRAIFNDENNLYYPDDIPRYQNSTFLAEDNGKELSEDLQLPYVKDTQKAQRLAKLFLVQKRATRKQYTLKGNPRMGTIAPFDTVTFNYPRRNINTATFIVIGHNESLLDGTMNVIIRPEDPSYYEWSANEATL